MARTRAKGKIETLEDFEPAYPDYEAMLADYHERVRRKAEKTIRAAINREYRRRVSQKWSQLKGISDRKYRSRRAREEVPTCQYA